MLPGKISFEEMVLPICPFHCNTHGFRSSNGVSLTHLDLRLLCNRCYSFLNWIHHQRLDGGSRTGLQKREGGLVFRAVLESLVEEVECGCRKWFDNPHCIPAMARFIISLPWAAGRDLGPSTCPGTYFPACLCLMIDMPLVRVGLTHLGFNPVECVNSPVEIP